MSQPYRISEEWYLSREVTLTLFQVFGPKREEGTKPHLYRRDGQKIKHKGTDWSEKRLTV